MSVTHSSEYNRMGLWGLIQGVHSVSVPKRRGGVQGGKAGSDLEVAEGRQGRQQCGEGCRRARGAIAIGEMFTRGLEEPI